MVRKAGHLGPRILHSPYADITVPLYFTPSTIATPHPHDYTHLSCQSKAGCSHGVTSRAQEVGRLRREVEDSSPLQERNQGSSLFQFLKEISVSWKLDIGQVMKAGPGGLTGA